LDLDAGLQMRRLPGEFNKPETFLTLNDEMQYLFGL
jgi:hypothetical protein